MALSLNNHSETVRLEDSASIVVIGGGPAGCFFAIEVLTQAARRGKQLTVTIIEKHGQCPVQVQTPTRSTAHREGCNYCAGGISPRLVDVLEQAGTPIPPEIIQSRVETITIQGSWKHIELPVPPGRKMLSVYRGSRPFIRSRREENLDSHLLGCAMDRGAQVITGEAFELEYSTDHKPIVKYRVLEPDGAAEHCVEADFVVVAGGVNQIAGMSLGKSELIKSFRKMVPEFTPPRVRKTLICELKLGEGVVHSRQNEVYFVEYGSRHLDVEMSSLIPKEEGLITLALLGRSVDRASEDERMRLITRFLELPHVRALLPRKSRPEIVCACFPNMTVGTARRPFGHRIAMIGDMVVARLYKDGILSAHNTATALASCILERGVDADSLRQGFWPTVEALKRDNRFGEIVFLLNRIAFSHQALSRILYQAVLTERRGRSDGVRRLETLFWKIASGDDSYRNILRSAVSYESLKGFFVGGLLVTIRNWLTELVFGLRWGEIGRYPTGVYHEVMEAKHREYADKIATPDPTGGLDFERMYSIKIRARKSAVMEQLGRFGERDMEYFRPRIVNIRRLSGSGNGTGKLIRYDTPFRSLTFSIVLEQVIDERYVVYRVCNGFAKGGVLIFDADEITEGLCVLSIYVAFNFQKGSTAAEKAYWKLFRHLFPQYTHDVLWNYALCQLKDIAEANSP